MPNYLISYSDHKVVLRNYEGYITTYEEPLAVRRRTTSPPAAYCQNPRPEPGQEGVLGLLQGERHVDRAGRLREVHARGNQRAAPAARPSKWVPYGVGAIEGTPRNALPVLAVGDGNAGGAGAEAEAPAEGYGPGEEPRPPEGEPTGSAHGELL